MKIVAEDKAVEANTNDFLHDWERSKSVQGCLRPDEALQHLQMYESKFARLKEERDKVAKAKEALQLQEPGKLLRILVVVVNQNQTCYELIKYVSMSSGVQCFDTELTASSHISIKLTQFIALFPDSTNFLNVPFIVPFLKNIFIKTNKCTINIIKVYITTMYNLYSYSYTCRTSTIATSTKGLYMQPWIYNDCMRDVTSKDFILL